MVDDRYMQGQILMSDNEDYTLNLVKGAVQSEDFANQYNLERLKLRLFNIGYKKKN